MTEYDPYRIDNPKPIAKNLSRDNVVDPTRVPNLVQIHAWGAYVEMRVE